MAVDEAILRLMDKPVIRFYRWKEPAVSLGYFQSWKVAPEGRPFVRRYTGGGLVDHEHDFTYSVMLPKEHPLSQAGTSASYEKIHEAVAEGLVALGFQAQLAPQEMPGDALSCFLKPVKFDVVLGASKLAGAAQRRTREGCLHQGSILLDTPEYDRMVDVYTPLLCHVLGGKPEPSELTHQEQERTRELTDTRYATREWNYSR